MAPPPPGLELGREITEDVGLTSQGLAVMSPSEARALVARLTAAGGA